MRINKTKMYLTILIALVSINIAGCGKSEEKKESTLAKRELFAMDTYMTLSAYGEKSEAALEEAVAEIERLDSLLSTGDSQSEVYIVNENGSEILSEDTAAIIEKSLELYESTEGNFDITIYPLMVEWGFSTENYKVPEEERIKELIKNVGAKSIEYDKKEKFLSLPEKVQIDFGGIAKGYTSDKIMDIFERYEIESGMVSLGGNVQLYGNKTDGSLWKVAVENPNDTSDYIGVIETKDKAIITSGGYERFFEENGEKWHHILDPKTGYPAKSGLTSVTIVSAEGMLADGLSTALFVMGKEKALTYWENNTDKFDTILVEEDGKITITEGLKDEFTSDYEFEVYKKR